MPRFAGWVVVEVFQVPLLAWPSLVPTTEVLLSWRPSDCLWQTSKDIEVGEHQSGAERMLQSFIQRAAFRPHLRRSGQDLCEFDSFVATAC